jgi:transposase
VRVCGMRTGISLSFTPSDLDRLRAVIKDRNAPQKHVWRAQIVLLSAEGAGTNAIKRETGKSKTCIWRWQERFAAEGVDGLLRDKTRPSRIAKLDPSVAERVVALTMEEPPHEATHWTSAAMADEAGVSASSVQRIWRAHGLQPHRVRQFKLSRTPNSSTSCATSSASTSIRRRTPLSFPSTKRARSRRSTERSPGCRSRKAAPEP